jgi:hypothetical protein
MNTYLRVWILFSDINRPVCGTKSTFENFLWRVDGRKYQSIIEDLAEHRVYLSQ